MLNKESRRSSHLGTKVTLVNISPSGVFKADSLFSISFFYAQWRVKDLTEVKTISEQLINEQIKAAEVRLIGEEGEQLGVVSIDEAMQKADEAGLDLVLIAPTANPPVCKIIDYGKFRYEAARKEKDAKKKQKVIEVKEVRLSPNIDENDLNTKISAARKFLEKGNKVKVSLRFRGREIARMNSSKYILDGFAEKLSDISTIDKPSKAEGRCLVMFLTAKKN